MKPHLLLTGPPRVGKTTLIEKSILHLKNSFQIDGFLTKEIREAQKRKGFEIIKINGERKILSHKNFKNFPKIGKYGVHIKNLEETIINIDPGKCEILIIDEIGKMELLSKKFLGWVTDLLTLDKPRILGTIGEKVLRNLERENDFSRCRIIRVTCNNREHLLPQIINFLHPRGVGTG